MTGAGNFEGPPSLTRTTKNSLLVEAFADAFEDILREVNRLQSRGAAGADGLIRFVDLLSQGASATTDDLAHAALARLDPHRGTDQIRDRDLAMIEVARSGLAYLLERKARDGAAKARLTRREHDLRISIQDYVSEREARRKALKAEWAASAKAGTPSPAPQKAARKMRSKPFKAS